MILKKKKIVGNVKFKRVEFVGRGVCEKVCSASTNNYCYDSAIRISCDKIYDSGIDKLKNYCYIYDCKKEGYTGETQIHQSILEI